MSEEANLRVFREMNEAENAHDVDRIATLEDEACYWESDSLPEPIRGREADRQLNQAMFAAFPDYHRDIEQSIASGDYVVIRWRMTGTHRGEWQGIAPTNQRIEIHGCSVIEFKNAKVARAWVYWDTGTVLRQLGVLPGSG